MLSRAPTQDGGAEDADVPSGWRAATIRSNCHTTLDVAGYLTTPKVPSR